MSDAWWQAARHSHCAAGNETANVPWSDEAFKYLLAPLLAAIRAEIVRRTQFTEALPRTVDELLAFVDDWTTGAGIAEGRGGYPEGGREPGWGDYVLDQRHNIEIDHAVVAAYGETNGARRGLFENYARQFTSSARVLGDGYEPHVDEVAGHLLHSLPVDSGPVSVAFSFGIGPEDVAVLLYDPYRPAVLEIGAHTRLQRSMLRGSKPMTERGFAEIVRQTLHASPGDLATWRPSWRRRTGITTSPQIASSRAPCDREGHGDPCFRAWSTGLASVTEIGAGEIGRFYGLAGAADWLGRQGSNLRMAASKAAALPLGDAPIGWPLRSPLP